MGLCASSDDHKNTRDPNNHSGPYWDTTTP